MKKMILLLMILAMTVLGNWSCGGHGKSSVTEGRAKAADTESVGMMDAADKARAGGVKDSSNIIKDSLNRKDSLDMRDSIKNMGTGYESGEVRRKEIRLPDGTVIVLHAGTVIHISKSFPVKNRELWLDGEAMFDVRPRAGKPFIVHTRHLKILVLGTRFRVDAYRKEAGEEVDLLSGKLRVIKSYHSDSDNEPETLVAGEMLMINRDIDLMEKEKMDGSELKAWNTGK
jgi:hypothetical protein